MKVIAISVEIDCQDTAVRTSLENLCRWLLIAVANVSDARLRAGHMDFARVTADQAEDKIVHLSSYQLSGMRNSAARPNFRPSSVSSTPDREPSKLSRDTGAGAERQFGCVGDHQDPPSFWLS